VADPTTPETWGVSVDQVTALAPHVTITQADPAPGGEDTAWAGTAQAQVSATQVTSWIGDVAARVSLRIHRRTLVTDPVMTATIAAAAHDLVLNGAGSYLVAAAFPAKAGTNDNTNYSAELWRRFTEGLNELDTAVDEWLTDNPGGAGPDTGAIVGSFPEPRFADDIAW